MSRILVVEDETHLAEGLRFNLKEEGHSVEVVGDGEAAVAQLLEQAKTFDAVILDVMLPGMDGFSVAAALREAARYVPVCRCSQCGRAPLRMCLEGRRCCGRGRLPAEAV